MDPTTIVPVLVNMCGICRRDIYKYVTTTSFVGHYCSECHIDGSVKRYEGNKDKSYMYRLGKHAHKWRASDR